MVDSSIYNTLRGSIEERNKGIRLMAKDQDFFRKLRAYILKNSGDEDHAKMVFNDSIIAFVKTVIRRPDLREQNVQRYWMGIAKNVWFDHLAKSKKQVAIVEMTPRTTNTLGEESTTQLIMQGECGELIRSVLDKLRSNCRAVLMYWAGGYKMKEIASLVGYKSDTMARKKKSECIKQLFDFLAANPTLKSQLRAY